VDGHTPSQTIGPYFHIGLPFKGGSELIDPALPHAIQIEGRVLDGNDDPVSDCMIEIWQADENGYYNHPDDPHFGERDENFSGFGRIHPDEDGRFSFVTCKPGCVAGPGNSLQAPHIMVSIFARGLLDRLVTRIYFGDEAEANLHDPLLNGIADPALRRTLIAEPDKTAGRYRFDIHLQGDGETVFFDI